MFATPNLTHTHIVLRANKWVRSRTDCLMGVCTYHIISYHTRRTKRRVNGHFLVRHINKRRPYQRVHNAINYTAVRRVLLMCSHAHDEVL